MELKTFKKDIAFSLAVALEITMLAWSASFGLLSLGIQTANAAALTSVSDTLADSGPSVATNHTITYTNATTTNPTETIVITFDPAGSNFSGVGSVVFANIAFTGGTLVSTCSAGVDNVALTATSTNSLTFTVCAGDSPGLAAGTKTIKINNNKITNPAAEGSYIIRIGGTQINSADTRVAVVNHVTVTASVDTTFTFTVAGLATSTALGNSPTTTGASTATSLPFGTLAPGVPKIMGQQLTVTTNANNGFAVTVHEDQDLTSLSGATIHLFKDGNATSTPSPWASPSNVLNQPNTYGHMGVTSDDADLVSGEYGTSTALYAGGMQSTSTQTIFSNTGPADGVAQNIGATKVAYKIEIGSLQPAATQYTNQLIYVATPVF